jgi:protein TonB
MQSQHFLFLTDTEPAAKARVRFVLTPPKIEPLHGVFAEAMLEDTSSRRLRSPFDWVVSIGVHAAILSALIVLPLFYSAGLDVHMFNLTFLALPAIPAAVPPPAPMTSSAAPRPSRITPARVLTAGLLTAPSFIPKAVTTIPGSAEAPPDEALLAVPGGVPGGIPGGQVGGVLGGLLGGALRGVPPPGAPLSAGPKAPLRVGGKVKPPRLLFGPDPDYPILARQARLSGIVVIEAVIDEHGNVAGMRVISGHPLLVRSALTAVSRRKYEPTVLDGEPIPIDLRLEITFSFS